VLRHGGVRADRVGLNVVVGYAGLLDLGYVAFFAVGSYTAAMLTSPDSPFTHIPYLWTIPVAMAVTMTFGVILGVPTLRLRGDYLAIVTLGFGEIVRILATIIPAMKGQVGFQNVGHPPGNDANGIPIFSNSNGIPWYWLTLVVIIIVLLLVGNLERSRVGRAWIAIREDEDAAEIMGVPTFKYKVWAFAIGASVGGLSGALFAGQVGFVNNQKFDVQTSILFLAAVVLRWFGQQGRCDPRWCDRGIHPAALHRDRGLQVPDLRRRARAADDLPVEGPHPRQAASARLWASLVRVPESKAERAAAPAATDG
jgi:ABC-type branched-chain amino acid transport system, permease component